MEKKNLLKIWLLFFAINPLRNSIITFSGTMVVLLISLLFWHLSLFIFLKIIIFVIILLIIQLLIINKKIVRPLPGNKSGNTNEPFRVLDYHGVKIISVNQPIWTNLRSIVIHFIGGNPCLCATGLKSTLTVKNNSLTKQQQIYIPFKVSAVAEKGSTSQETLAKALIRSDYLEQLFDSRDYCRRKEIVLNFDEIIERVITIHQKKSKIFIDALCLNYLEKKINQAYFQEEICKLLNIPTYLPINLGKIKVLFEEDLVVEESTIFSC